MSGESKENIEIRSDEVQDILGQVPRWIVRWGIVIIFASVGMILLGTWLFKYPDIKRAAIIVTTENPPATLVARSSGQIKSLFVKDNQYVESGTHLAVIENPANYTDLISLQYDMAEIRTILINPDKEGEIDLPGNYNLGEIQPAWAEFSKIYQDYWNFLKLNYHALKIESLNEEVKKYELYSRRLANQGRILKQELELARRQFNRDSMLYVQLVIPAAEYEKSESNKLQKEFNYEDTRVKLSSTEIEISKLNQEILDLELKSVDEKKQQEIALLESFDNLGSRISMWEQDYLLKAPISGKVVFNKIWSENQNVRTGDNVLTVVPSDQGEIIGKIDLPIQGSGKVMIGQAVNIQFMNFPHLQYGMVRGVIRSISMVPDDQLYSVEVSLPDGLVTLYGIEMSFNQEMQGTAEIITDDRRLLERIFSPFRSLVSEQSRPR